MVANGRRDVVLLVDDEESFRLSVVDGLARYHERFSIVTAADGVEALEAIEKHNPSLVVSDIRMPRLDGVELLVTCRKQYPSIHFVLLSAYFSEALERSARTFGATRILHKPLDLQVLVQAIIEVLRHRESMPPAGGYLPAFSLPGFLQLLAMEQKSCVLRLEEVGVGEGRLWIENGRPVDAEVGEQTGTPAALTLLGWPSPDITLQSLSRDFERRITEGVNFLLMESARMRDENEQDDSDFDAALSFADLGAAVETQQSLAAVSDPFNPSQQQETLMASMEETLKSLQDIGGFKAVGVFSPDGEIMAQVANAGTEIDSIGALANDVLLKAQKATDVMNVGRGNLCVVSAPRATILVRCLNENTDFAANEPGRAHLHCAMVLEPDGNLGLAKMQLDKVMQQLAPMAR